MTPCFKLIAAVARDGGIGYQGGLLFSIPEDMRHFKELTTGKTIIMGRGTLESLPGGKPLPNRRNLVLTSAQTLNVENVELFHSIPELLSSFEDTDEVWVIGGASVYEALLPYCSELYLTEVDDIRPADRFFPTLSAEWERVECGAWQEYHGIAFRFVRWKRNTL